MFSQKRNPFFYMFLLSLSLFLSGCSKPVQPETVPAATTINAPTSTPVPTSTPAPTSTPIPTSTPAPDFYRVSGTDIVDSDGAPVYLKGIAMGNMVWSFNTPVANDHNEESFRELSELGFNCVRFYLSCHFFESDDAPYKYKESGFAWLDENIAWAKKHNIRLILNMHAPQGGYQSQGKGLALWQEEENQNRLTALWTEIARRYADEETIIGYGLINEPCVPSLDDLTSTVAQCSSLMQRITDSIRTQDKNHIIFVERLCAVINADTGESNWNLSTNDLLYIINDTNTVYEFHCYDPHSFTHQNMDWSGTGNSISFYPSEEPVFQDVISYWTGCNRARQIQTLEDGWSLFESDFSSLSDTGNAGSITLQAAHTGIGGFVLFDDIIVEEYKDGVLHRTIAALDFEDTDFDDFHFWAENGSGGYSYREDGYGNTRCLALSGTTSDANVTGFRFQLKEGYEYKIHGKVKCINTASNCSARPRIDYSQFKAIFSQDINYLETRLLPYIAFGEKHQVPIYLGEFGVCIPAWESNAGAAQWVTDMLTLCNKYRLHFNYHSYQDYWFGLYRFPMDDPHTKRNTELAEIFKELLKE